jgi:lipopolysaccharide export system permease protein
VGFVTLGFVSLFFFFDLVDELRGAARAANAAAELGGSLVYVALQVPNHLYELLPITTLIGAIYVMARLAQSSEYTILRTSGLGPGRALATLLQLGAALVLLTFVMGDYVAPAADRQAQLLRAETSGRITVGRTGAWLKARDGDRNIAVNVSSMAGDASLRQVRLFEFEADGRLVTQTEAQSARFEPGAWRLAQVQRLRFPPEDQAGLGIARESLPELMWPTDLTADMVSTALLKPDRMSTLDLFHYIRHLRANGQSAQRYEIEFWRKVFYPLSCMVMVVLALPFAYLHFRRGGITGYVFGGVMVGVSFFLLNNVFGYIGNLNNWVPWITAAAPGLIYTLASLAAFGWLVLRR